MKITVKIVGCAEVEYEEKDIITESSSFSLSTRQEQVEKNHKFCIQLIQELAQSVKNQTCNE